MSITSDRLTAYLAAEAKILAGQSVRWGDRQLTRADLAEVRTAIKDLQRQQAAERRGGLSVGVATFRCQR